VDDYSRTNRRPRTQAPPDAALPTTELTWTGLGSKPVSAVTKGIRHTMAPYLSYDKSNISTLFKSFKLNI
jgi:hypothetical protein